MKKIILAAAVVMLSTPALAAGLMCKSDRQVMCNQNNCRSFPPATWRVIDITNLQIHRCDKKGCDAHKIKNVTKSVDAGNMYMNLIFGGGAILRLGLNSHKFVETATHGLHAYISHGVCREN